MAAATELTIRRPDGAASAARRRINFVIFLGPAIMLTAIFFVIPVLVDVAVSFTDLDRSLRFGKFTTEQYHKVFRGDPRLTQVIGLTFVYVFGTLAIFNVTFGLVLALTTTSAQQVIRWLFSRRLAAAAHEPIGAVHSAVAVGDQPVGCGAAEPIPDTDDRSDKTPRSDDERPGCADHHRQWLYRRVNGDDHLHRGDKGHSRAFVLRRSGRWCWNFGADPFHHASCAALADQFCDDLPDAVAVGELRIHPVAHQGWPVLRHHSLRPLRLPARFR